MLQVDEGRPVTLRERNVAERRQRILNAARAIIAADGVQAVNTFVGFWWLLCYPCGLLVVTLMALNFVGDGLRDAYDPKSRADTLV